MNPTPTFAGTVSNASHRIFLLASLLASAACNLKNGPPSEESNIVESLRRHHRPGPTVQTSTGEIKLGERDQTDANFEVWNAGSGALDWKLTVEPGNGPDGWLSASPSSGSSTGEHDLVDVSIRRDDLAPGAYVGLIHVDAGTQRKDVRVSAQIVGVQTSVTDHAFGFDPGPFALDVWNAGYGQLSFNVTSKPAWLSVDPMTGTSTSKLDARKLQLTTDRAGLAPGHYAGSLVIEPDPDQGPRSAEVDVSMDVDAQGGVLVVTPDQNLSSSGSVGGPFAPGALDYVVANHGDANLDWTASSSEAWLRMSPAGGTLAPAATATVTASIDQAYAATLKAQAYHAAVAFSNATNGRGDATRSADLVVNDPSLKAAIFTTPNPMKIAPYTTLFSGLDSTSKSSTIVRWNWDFGDSSTGNPQTDEEMLVVHRFDQPGSYTVKLTVTDSTGSTNTTTTTVDVSEFNGRTFYVSSSAGNDSNDGSSGRPFKTLGYAFGKMASNQQNHPDRLLLACGDKWTSSSDLSPPKPGILDSYGSGARPIIEFTSANNGLGWYGGSGGTPDTWGYSPIVSNLNIRYTGRNGSDTLVNPFIRGATFRNCTIENGGIIGALQHEGLVIEGCDISYAVKVGVYSSGDTVVLRRSNFTGSGTDSTYHHQAYLNNGDRWLLEDCVFDGANTGKNNNAVKLNGGIGVVVRRCEARGSRNGFDAGRNLEETGGPAADNYLFDECTAHDNGFDGQGTGLFVSWISNVTVRNSVFYNHDSSSGGQGAIWMWKSNASVNHVNLYNNVFHSNTLPDLYMETPKYQLVMRNNVFSRDVSGSSGGFVRLEDSGSMLPLIDSNHNVYFWTGKGSADSTFGMSSGSANLSFDAWKGSKGKDAAGRYGNPAFTDPAKLDFTLKTGSPAIDIGEILATVSRDKVWVARPQGASADAGVFER